MTNFQLGPKMIPRPPPHVHCHPSSTQTNIITKTDIIYTRYHQWRN